jgi:hypothetical protein
MYANFMYENVHEIHVHDRENGTFEHLVDFCRKNGGKQLPKLRKIETSEFSMAYLSLSGQASLSLSIHKKKK